MPWWFVRLLGVKRVVFLFCKLFNQISLWLLLLYHILAEELSVLVARFEASQSGSRRR